MATSQSVREEHEAFVSGHNGSSPHDIILAVYPTIPATITAAVFGQRWPGLFGLLLESILLVTPLTLSFTYLANYTLELSAFLMTTAGIAAFFIPTKKSRCNAAHHKDTSPSSKRLGYFTALRAHLNLVTVTAILAVDFHSYPRRFVKTEEYGYSLMDLGAAAFVICNGTVEGKKRPSYKAVLKDGIILAVLGFLRLALVRAADYQHHVTEYGMHANFFFTLAFVKLICSWWIWRLTCSSRLLLGIFTSICHQVYLILGHGAEWTLSDVPRDTLILANREWIVALPGYMSLFFIGSSIGDYIFRIRYRKSITIPAVVSSVISAVILIAFHFYVGPPSRRLANPTFVCFCVCFLLLIIAHYSLIDETLSNIFPGSSWVPATFCAINQHPLLFFLLANVVTGLINKSTNTLDIVYPHDLLIINGYVIGLVSVVLYLYSKDNKLKTL